ncbi:MAG: hypothetical protein R3F29_01335 [Planctomycetota bacterium]
MKFAPSLLALFAVSALHAQCPLPAAGTSLGQNGVLFDGWTAAVPFGFSIVVKGVSYDAAYVSDHGVLALTDSVTGLPGLPGAGGPGWTYTPAVASMTTAPGPVLAAYWSDHSISYGTNVGETYVDTGGGNQCTISWIDAETYIDGVPFSVSVTIRSSGTITYTFDGRVNNEGSTFGALNAVIGIGFPGGVNAPANLGTDAFVGSDSFSEEFVTTAPLTPNPNFDLNNLEITFVDAGIGVGWAIVQTPLPCGSATAVGTGCDGLSLVSTTPPAIGAPWDLTMSGVNASSIAFALPNFLSFGAALPGTPIGVLVPDLFGPTCLAYQDAALGLIDGGAASLAGDVVFSIGVPNTLFLLGASLSCQGVAIRDLFVTPTFSLSNGVNGLLGY